MDFLMELDDITVWLDSYASRAVFISEAAEAERSYFTRYEKEEGYSTAAHALKITDTYREIIDDYLRLIQGKVNELNKLTERLYAERRAQKQNAST